LNHIKHPFNSILMGIPSYYSYIIKNHPNIFKRLSKNLKFEYLYLDSNSIIYDSIKLVDYTTDTDLFETTLIDKVYHKNLAIRKAIQ
jgi:5''-3'' exonuclease